MNIRKTIISVVTLAVLLGGAFGGYQVLVGMKEPPQKKKPLESKKYVRTQKVNYGDVQTEIIAFGRVASDQPLDVISEVSGRILKGDIRLKAGQNFQKGAVLFRVDDTEARLNLQSSKSNFLKSIASILADFKIDFPDRYPTWNDYFTQIEVEKPLPELPKVSSAKEKTYLATRDIFTQYYSIKSTEERLSKYRIVAPYSGSVAEVMLEEGSFTNVGGKVARIIRTDLLELKVPVEASDVQWITRSAAVEIVTENGMQSWKGNVSRIADVVNPNTQSIDVFISVYPNQYPIFDGLYMKAAIPGSIVKGAMEVPRNAVFNNNEVFTLEQDSILRVKQIKVHKINQETIVFSGLPEGAELVFEPLVNAYDGMKAQKLESTERFRNLQATDQRSKQLEEPEKKETTL